jgi:ABC-2 type transport system ATP-binding protein
MCAMTTAIEAGVARPLREPVDATSPVDGEGLELRHVSKRFGSVRALRDCSFSVSPGRMLGFLGPNGAGKTTAMRAVFGLVLLDAGDVLWGGRPAGRAERLRFGYMPEERGLYPRMPVGEQLEYFGRLHGLGATAARAAATHWLERLGLADRAGAKLEELSHGNQQRAQLAAALVHRPELLLLDEPFAGLDPVAVETLADVLRGEAARGAAVLFSSHQLELVEDICQEVAIIDHGRLVATGTSVPCGAAPGDVGSTSSSKARRRRGGRRSRASSSSSAETEPCDSSRAELSTRSRFSHRPSGRHGSSPSRTGRLRSRTSSWSWSADERSAADRARRAA